MLYKELKEIQAKELNEFTSKYCFWAFGREQLNKKLQELGITEEELQKNYVSFYGGAIRADKAAEYRKIAEKHNQQLAENMKDFDFARSAFLYELNNHEYGYTYNGIPALDALNLTIQEVADNLTLNRAYCEACEQIKDTSEY